VLVCHCRRVNDHAITETVDAGASSIDEVGAQCGAGTRCGGCWPTIQELLAKLQDASVGVRRHLEAVPSPS
jgi:bacterioferritin-associated ferredoxin